MVYKKYSDEFKRETAEAKQLAAQTGEACWRQREYMRSFLMNAC